MRAGALSPRRVVDGVSFSVTKGEVLGVVGKFGCGMSGCGKSTRARLMIGFAPLTGGRIVFDGRQLGKDMTLREPQPGAQMVFNNRYASLTPRPTSEDSIAFDPRVRGVTPDAARALAHDPLRRIGLGPTRFAGRHPHELSGGRRQRANIGRALAMLKRVRIPSRERLPRAFERRARPSKGRRLQGWAAGCAARKARRSVTRFSSRLT